MKKSNINIDKISEQIDIIDGKIKDLEYKKSVLEKKYVKGLLETYEDKLNIWYYNKVNKDYAQIVKLTDIYELIDNALYGNGITIMLADNNIVKCDNDSIRWCFDTKYTVLTDEEVIKKVTAYKNSCIDKMNETISHLI